MVQRAAMFLLSVLSLRYASATLLRNVGTPNGELTEQEARSLAAKQHAAMGLEVGTCRNLERLQTVRDKRMILCFMLVRPYSNEIPLLELALKKGILAGCNDYLILSNTTLKALLPHSLGLVEKALNFEDAVPAVFGPIEGNWKVYVDPFTLTQKSSASLLGQIYADAVWPAVDEYARKKDYDWVVKIDVDTVLLPRRLRYLLSHTVPPEEQIVALGTKGPGCGQISGALGVYSRAAIELLARKDKTGCRFTLEEKMNNGESGLADGCIRRFGKIWPQKHIIGTNEGCCGRGCDWTVAVHPLKDADTWQKCVEDFELDGTEACSGQLSPDGCENAA